MIGSGNVGVYGVVEGNPGWSLNQTAFSLMPNVSCWLDGEAMQTVRLPSGGSISVLGNENNLLSCINKVNSSNSREHELLITTFISPRSLNWLLDYIVFESIVNPNLD